jgi:hypothetical protein
MIANIDLNLNYAPIALRSNICLLFRNKWTGGTE